MNNYQFYTYENISNISNFVPVIKLNYMKGIISYLKHIRAESYVMVMFFSILITSSCTNRNRVSESENFADVVCSYRTLLSHVRRIDILPADSLATHITKWINIRDSVLITLRRDTLNPHSTLQFEFRLIDDSVRIELARIAASGNYSFSDVLSVKEKISPYTGDGKLVKAAESIRSFFDSLDENGMIVGGKQKVLSCYRTFLTETLKDSITDIEQLQEFIKQEDVVYRSFLANLHDYGDTDLSDITRATEKCCSQVFDAANRGGVSYRDAMVYMALRNNRRIVQNVLACLRDIRCGRIHDREQAWAYGCMILQPYVSIDGICMALMSQEERYVLTGIASDTSWALLRLHEIIRSERHRLSELPAMLLEFLVLTI